MRPKSRHDEYVERFRRVAELANSMPDAAETRRRLEICRVCGYHTVDTDGGWRCMFASCGNPEGSKVVFTCPLVKHRCPKNKWLPDVPDSGPPFVSVCIASCEEGPEIKATVESVLASAIGPLEVIVVDDASTDGSCDGLATLDARVKLLRNERRKGVGWSTDRAFKAARGDVLFKIDAHMRFEEGMFHGLATVALEKNGIVCGIITGMGEKKTVARGGAIIHFADWDYRNYEIALDWQRPPTGTEPEKRMAVMGACYGFPRKVWELMGEYPSTSANWGAEEQAISAWAWTHDVPIYAVPGWIGEHLYRYKAVTIPWGGPDVSSRQLNILANKLHLFDWQTYCNIWRPRSLHLLTMEHRLTLALEEQKECKASHVWKRGRAKTDAEFFRDVMYMPTVVTDSKAIERIRPLSVILAVRNEGDEVWKTLSSLINRGQSRFEVVVVDDASTDGSVGPGLVDILKTKVRQEWRVDLHKRIKIIRHEIPIGSSASRAEGIRAASGEILSIWDGHQRLDTWFGIERLATTAQDRGGIIIPAVRNMGNPLDGKHTYGAKFQLKGEPWGILNKHLETPCVGIERRQAVIGCGYTLTRETLETLGGWPELPGVWAYQEQWLGFRAYFLDIPLWVDGDIKTEHRYKKEFNYLCTRQDSHGNGHFCLAVHFPETYESFWKARLPADVFCPDPTAERDRWLAFHRIKSERDFFKECLEIEGWPPVAR